MSKTISKVSKPRPKLLLQTGHTVRVSTLAFSPDSRLLASGSHDGNVILWDARKGELLRVFSDHHPYGQTIAFSPDGKLLAFSGGEVYDRCVRLFEVETGKLVREIIDHREKGQDYFSSFRPDITAITFSPDGQTLACGYHRYESRGIGLCRVETGVRFQHLFQPDAPMEIISLDFSPDGRHLACGENGNDIEIWNVETGTMERKLIGHEEVDFGPIAFSNVHSVTFSPDGKTLASAGFDNTVRIWDWKTGQSLQILRYDGHVVSVSFSSDGAILQACYTEAIVFWEWESGTIPQIFTDQLKDADAAAFSPDGQFVATGGRESGDVTLWERESKQIIRILGGSHEWVFDVAFAPDGQQFVTAGGATAPALGSLRLWNAKSGEPQKSFVGAAAVLNSVSFSPDGTLIAAGGDNKTVHVWETESSRVVRQIEGQTGRIEAVEFSPNGRILAVGDWGDDDTIRLWDMLTANLITQWACPGVQSLQFSADGRFLASGDITKEVNLWNLTDTHAFATFDDHKSGVVSIAISPDSRLVVSAGTDAYVGLWDVEAQKLVGSVSHDIEPVNCVAFSPNGQLLATGGSDGIITLWDVASVLEEAKSDSRNAEPGKVLLYNPTGRGLALKGHAAGVFSVAFSPDGTTLLSAAHDKTLKLWNTKTGKLRATLEMLPANGEDPSAINWIIYTPAGNYQCSLGATRFIRWRVGDQVMPAEDYTEKYHRPDLVAKALQVKS